MSELINAVGAVASVLGFSMQTIDIINKRIVSANQKEIQEINNSFKSLIFIRNPAKAWKDFHMVYSSLHTPFLRLYETVSDGNGHQKPEESIAPGTLKQLFQEPTMMSALTDIEQRLETATDTLKTISERRKATKADYEELNSKGGIFSELSLHCRTINNALDNALSLHQRFCKFFDQIEVYKTKNLWDAKSVHFIVENRPLYVNAVDNMLTYSDGAVMALLDIYIRIVSEIEQRVK